MALSVRAMGGVAVCATICLHNERILAIRGERTHIANSLAGAAGQRSLSTIERPMLFEMASQSRK
jgi:hypothetical protein